MTLIGYWPLNEESGDTAYDHSGNENHGDIEGDTEVGASGILGSNACKFPNRTDRISVPNTDVLNPERITLTAWTKFDHLDDGDGTQSSIFRKYNAYVLYAEDSSRGMQFYNWEDGERLSSGAVPKIGVWEFWAITNNGSKIRLYRNGKEVALAEGTFQASSSNDLGIGDRGDQDGTSYGMKGSIQEARIYSRALTASEVQYLYNVGRRGRFVSRRKSP